MSKHRLGHIGRLLGRWLPAVLLALLFLVVGAGKFSDTGPWAAMFRQWGYPGWFRVLVGVLELIAALLLLSGRAAALGAALIVALMVGAIGTHLLREHGHHLASTLGPLVLATIVLLLRREQLRPLLRLVPGAAARPGRAL